MNLTYILSTNEMKVAVVYSGLPNITRQIYDNHKLFLIDHYDCDIFYSTWDCDGVDQTISILNARKFEIESWSTAQNIFKELLIYTKNKRKEVRPINVFSMYYKIAKSTQLLDQTYEVVVRHRFDTTYTSKVVLDTNNTIKVCKGQDHGGLNDRWAYGPVNLMNIYSELFKYIPLYIIFDSITFHPETLLRHHCIKNKLPITRTNDIVLLRGA